MSRFQSSSKPFASFDSNSQSDMGIATFGRRLADPISRIRSVRALYIQHGLEPNYWCDLNSWTEPPTYETPRASPFFDPAEDWISIGEGAAIPAHHFAGTRQLYEALLAERLLVGEPLNIEEVITLAVNNQTAALAPFSAGAINALNAAYYRLPEAFTRKGAADFFQESQAFNAALGRYFCENCRGHPIQIAELAAGKRLSRWRHVVNSIPWGTKLAVILTDYCADALPSLEDWNQDGPVQLESSIVNLLAPDPLIAKFPKLDFMLATYAFDSIWRDEDSHYEKLGDRLFRSEYRLVVPDWHPHRSELLKHGLSWTSLSEADLSAICIEKRAVPTRLAGGDQQVLKQHFDLSNLSRAGYPGGLVKVVTQAFEECLKPTGCFVIADCGSYDHGSDGGVVTPELLSSGRVARYRPLDFLLAEQILQSRGFRVAVISVMDFVFSHLDQKELPERAIREMQGEDSGFVMLISRAC
ncbi:MAG: hypothetical protein KDD42_01405 [Bdellovibrionales bacterium]|nr:hypothetical protein [Bdellovibrionales bacterium]